MCDLNIEYNVSDIASKVNVWCKILLRNKTSGEKLVKSVIPFCILSCAHGFIKFQLCKKKTKEKHKQKTLYARLSCQM